MNQARSRALDRLRFERILSNLLENAATHGDGPTRISIEPVPGKRGSAPTMVLSRAAFGVNGQKVPGVVSWLVSIGWETFLAILAVLATATIFDQLGWSGGTTTKVVATVVVALLIVSASVAGYHVIMRMQSVLTWITGIVTVLYMAFTIDDEFRLRSRKTRMSPNWRFASSRAVRRVWRTVSAMAVATAAATENASGRIPSCWTTATSRPF